MNTFYFCCCVHFPANDLWHEILWSLPDRYCLPSPSSYRKKKQEMVFVINYDRHSNKIKRKLMGNGFCWFVSNLNRKNQWPDVIGRLMKDLGKRLWRLTVRSVNVCTNERLDVQMNKITYKWTFYKGFAWHAGIRRDWILSMSNSPNWQLST